MPKVCVHWLLALCIALNTGSPSWAYDPRCHSKEDLQLVEILVEAASAKRLINYGTTTEQDLKDAASDLYSRYKLLASACAASHAKLSRSNWVKSILEKSGDRTEFVQLRKVRESLCKFAGPKAVKLLDRKLKREDFIYIDQSNNYLDLRNLNGIVGEF